MIYSKNVNQYILFKQINQFKIISLLFLWHYMNCDCIRFTHVVPVSRNRSLEFFVKFVTLYSFECMWNDKKLFLYYFLRFHYPFGRLYNIISNSLYHKLCLLNCRNLYITGLWKCQKPISCFYMGSYLFPSHNQMVIIQFLWRKSIRSVIVIDRISFFGFPKLITQWILFFLLIQYICVILNDYLGRFFKK